MKRISRAAGTAVLFLILGLFASVLLVYGFRECGGLFFRLRVWWNPDYLTQLQQSLNQSQDDEQRIPEAVCMVNGEPVFVNPPTEKGGYWTTANYWSPPRSEETGEPILGVRAPKELPITAFPSFVGRPVHPNSITLTSTSGWPWTSLVGYFDIHTNAGGLQLDTRCLVDIGARSVPVMPYLPGMTANAACFGAGLWLLWTGGLRVRAWQRVRKGRCARCGYVRHGLAAHVPCPECAWLPVAAAPTP